MQATTRRMASQQDRSMLCSVRSPAVALTCCDTLRAARAAAATGAGSAVEKTYGRPRLVRNVMRAADPATKPPWQPNALLKVPTLTSTCAPSRCCSAHPAPLQKKRQTALMRTDGHQMVYGFELESWMLIPGQAEQRGTAERLQNLDALCAVAAFDGCTRRLRMLWRCRSRRSIFARHTLHSMPSRLRD